MTQGVDNRTGPHPCLVAKDIRRVHRLRSEGATARQIAAVMAVSVRTVYRYLAAYLVTQSIEGHPLTFIVYPRSRPVLIEGRARR